MSEPMDVADWRRARDLNELMVKRVLVLSQAGSTEGLTSLNAMIDEHVDDDDPALFLRLLAIDLVLLLSLALGSAAAQLKGGDTDRYVSSFFRSIDEVGHD